MYAWFNRHLELGLEEPIVEREFRPLPPVQLAVLDDAHPLPADAVDEERLRAAMTSAAGAQLADLVPGNADELAEFRRVVGGALEVLTSAALPEPDAVETPAELTVQSNVAVLYLRGADNVHAHHDIEMLSGTVGVLVELSDDLDPLLDPQRHDLYAGYSWGYNPTILARRVQRVLDQIAWARELEGIESVRLLATGNTGPIAILALALAGDAVDRAACEWSWDFDDVEEIDDERMLPGALRYGGLPYFAGLCAPMELRLYGLAEAPDVTRACYEAADEAGKLTAIERLDREELAAWLSAPPD
ncbi:MAG: hypothetical protein O7B99_00875 [Planctomycetota bacterium]|nr:hypothetical protein [Planctomycetota bacterium]